MPFVPKAQAPHPARRVVPFLLLEAGLAAVACLLHAGTFGRAHSHPQAGTAEGLVMLACLTALAILTVLPGLARGVGLFFQGLALAGTVLAAVVVTTGGGSHGPVDIGLHVALAAILLMGLQAARSL